MSVKLKFVKMAESGESRIKTITPYLAKFVEQAREIGGKWNADNGWLFDPRDEQRVRALLVDCYGTDGTRAVESVVLQITAKKEIAAKYSAIFFANRQIAWAPGRDTGARLGPGVICLKGDYKSGGSARQSRTIIAKGAKFEVKDVPVSFLPEAENDEWEIFVVTTDDARKNNLIAEREKLIARIDEIDAELDKL